MVKIRVLLVCGLCVFSTPFLGIPQTWVHALLFVVGATILVIGLMFRFEIRRSERTRAPGTLFVEHDPWEVPGAQ